MKKYLNPNIFFKLNLIVVIFSLTQPGSKACSITTTVLMNATQGTIYSQMLGQTGMISPTWQLIGGSTLPTGLNLNTNTGEITGTPTGVGDFFFNIQASEGACITTMEFTLTILPDPLLCCWDELSKVKSSNTGQANRFGSSVDISGDYAIAGSPNEPFGGFSIIIDPLTGLPKVVLTGLRGAAYIMKNDGTAWSEEIRLQASDTEDLDFFGTSVSISGNYAIVGAPGEDTGFEDAGAAYLFERNNSGIWTEVSKIQASDLGQNYEFGRSVSISGNYIAISSPGWDFTNNPSDPSFFDGQQTGATYIYERDIVTGLWLEVAILTLNPLVRWVNAGASIAISGDYLVVGVPMDDAGVGLADAGSIYIYERDALGNWNQISKHFASDPESQADFGASVDISGTQIIVGTPGKDESGIDAGVAYIFERNSIGVWSETTKITAFDEIANANFGSSVSISGDQVFIGAENRTEAGNVGAGAGYAYKKTGGSWLSEDKIVASDASSASSLGSAVAISGDNVIMGSERETPAMNANGASYFYKLEELAPLPIELLNFDVKRINKEEILLIWQTATEKNNLGFEIEQSEDGINFYPVRFVKGQGNSINLYNYQSVINNPNSAYYRLRQIDFDGSSYKSSIIFVAKEKEEDIFYIYPNPAKIILVCIPQKI